MGLLFNIINIINLNTIVVNLALKKISHEYIHLTTAKFGNVFITAWLLYLIWFLCQELANSKS